MKKTFWTALALFASAAYGGEENIAKGKSYVFDAKPNYKLCTDAGDLTDLTDGRFNTGKGGFWTSKATVGWVFTGKDTENRTVTVDLGRDEPICGFSWNFAAGAGGVTHPHVIFVYVSVDGKNWRFAGDLLSQAQKENGALNYNGYEVYRAWSVKMPCHGRYVKFLVRGTVMIFVDEIEVYRGGEAERTALDGEPPIADVSGHYEAFRSFQNFYSDAKRIGDAALNLKPEARKKLHEALVALNALILRGRGFEKPFFWSCDRWASADFLDLPPDAQCMEAPLEVEMMRGETRSAAVNVSNPTDGEIDLEVKAEGFPADANVALREVVPTMIKSGRRVGALLKGEGTSSLKLRLPPGAARQLWVSFDKPRCAAGVYRGRLAAPGASKELTLRLSSVTFPQRPRLHVGGWDYLDRNGRAFRSTSNVTQRLARILEMHGDSPWATKAVMPWGAKFNRDGALLNASSLDYREWDAWTRLWGENARQYCVFIAVTDEFCGEKMGTSRFKRMVGEYMRAWYDRIRPQLNGRRVVLLIVDEPNSVAQDETTKNWAQAIKAAAPEFALFVDADRSPPSKFSAEIFEYCDIICPPLPSITAKGTVDYYEKLRRERGKEIWLYSCCGPVRIFDPVVYFRGQAWYAWKIGATGSMFWAFGAAGSIADSFRPFAQTSEDYSPFFVSPTGAFRAKQSEALMEGVQDYEYLSMLRERIDRFKAQGRNVAEYERLLAETVESALPKEAWLKNNVYKFFESASRYDWSYAHDHVSMDEARIKILRALEKLAAEK